MMSKRLLLSVFIINFLFFISCGQNDDANNMAESTIKMEQVKKPRHRSLHAYGGWYCPDNIMGFPAADIQEMDNLPIINGRLPTKEETQNGTSLMYFDTIATPDARPLNMTMPKLARYYSRHTKKNELVIVIQAVIAEQDTVVGFRYLNGGNGSAWFDEVTFVADEEVDKLGATPFISMDVVINAPREKVEEIISKPIYAEALDEVVNKTSFLIPDWQKKPKKFYAHAPDGTLSEGLAHISGDWGIFYIQVDYDFDSKHYVEKFLVSEDKNSKNAKLHIVSGPYGKDFERQKMVWNNWLQKVKKLSEGE